MHRIYLNILNSTQKYHATNIHSNYLYRIQLDLASHLFYWWFVIIRLFKIHENFEIIHYFIWYEMRRLIGDIALFFVLFWTAVKFLQILYL